MTARKNNDTSTMIQTRTQHSYLVLSEGIHAL